MKFAFILIHANVIFLRIRRLTLERILVTVDLKLISIKYFYPKG